MRTISVFAVFGLVACGSADLPSGAGAASIRGAAAPAVSPQATFASTYGQTFCEKSTACNPSLACSPVVPERAGCAYDAEAAAQCLSGAWTCNTEFTGYEFAQAPAACGQVWDCAVARR